MLFGGRHFGGISRLIGVNWSFVSFRRKGSVQRVGSSGAGVGASVMVVSVGAGWERLVEMERAVDQPTRGEASECFAKSAL